MSRRVKEPKVELADIIPKSGEVRTLYCDDCGHSMDLTFPDFTGYVSGVQIQISNLPHLDCPACSSRYLTDNGTFAIVELHRQAVAKGSDLVRVNRKKRQADYTFTDVPFLVDADDYYYIPGLHRSFDPGFLTPLFFNKTVLSKFDTLPGYEVRFASQSYGTINMSEDYIPFGINRHGKVIMWLGDVSKLPESEQFYLRSENVPSDHAIGSEFYDGQISCIFTDPPMEAIAIKGRSALAKAFEVEFSAKLFHLDDELVDTIARLTPPVIDTEKERKHAFDSLNRIFVESLDSAGFEKLARTLGLKLTSSGSLKRLQAILESKDASGLVGTALSPFYVIYDLRIAYSHLTSASRRQELLDTAADRLGLAKDARLDALYSAILSQMIASMEKLKDLLR